VRKEGREGERKRGREGEREGGSKAGGGGAETKVRKRE
jgi:hypothetical protein